MLLSVHARMKAIIFFKAKYLLINSYILTENISSFEFFHIAFLINSNGHEIEEGEKFVSFLFFLIFINNCFYTFELIKQAD